MSELSNYNGLMEKKPAVLKKLNLQQDLFCKTYATDPEVLGNQTQAYMKVYGCSLDSAKITAMNLMKKPEITARINEYLEKEGFNNENADKQLLFLMNQHKDFTNKLGALREYNKLKKRVSDRLELVIPKPIVDPDDDSDRIEPRTARKVDKGNGNVSQYEVDD